MDEWVSLVIARARVSCVIVYLVSCHSLEHECKIWTKFMLANYFYHLMLNYSFTIVKHICFLTCITVDHLDTIL